MKLKIKKGIWLLVAFGWWGVLYPELCLMEDTYRIVYEDSQEAEEELSASELYYKLLSSEPEQIKIKSKLWETVMAYIEKGKEK